jgi:large subunit ribosomal protein L10Ae
MSKINSDFLKKSIGEMVSTRKQRKFLETVELQIGLRDYDPDKRFNGTVRLPYQAYNNMKVPPLFIQVCVLANAAHIDECVANKIPYIDVEGLKAFNKDKSKIKKWGKKYDLLLASDSVAKQVTKLLGNVLVKMGLFPITLAEGEKIVPKIQDLKHSAKFQSKKASCMGTAVGNVETGDEKLRQNIVLSINFLVSLMKKGWQNVGTLHIKTSMGKSYKIFG